VKLNRRYTVVATGSSKGLKDALRIRHSESEATEALRDLHNRDGYQKGRWFLSVDITREQALTIVLTGGDRPDGITPARWRAILRKLSVQVEGLFGKVDFLLSTNVPSVKFR